MTGGSLPFQKQEPSQAVADVPCAKLVVSPEKAVARRTDGGDAAIVVDQQRVAGKRRQLQVLQASGMAMVSVNLDQIKLRKPLDRVGVDHHQVEVETGQDSQSVLLVALTASMRVLHRLIQIGLDS